QLGKLADRTARSYGTDDGIRASRFLARNGHSARQDDAGRALGLGQGALENMAVTAASQAEFSRGKKVLITRPSRFKGSWPTFVLHRLGAKVTGIALPPLTTPSLFTAANISALCRSHFLDIRDAAGLAGVIRAERPEIVFHLAAQPLVRESYRDPLT